MILKMYHLPHYIYASRCSARYIKRWYSSTVPEQVGIIVKDSKVISK